MRTAQGRGFVWIAGRSGPRRTKVQTRRGWRKRRSNGNETDSSGNSKRWEVLRRLRIEEGSSVTSSM
jgi:hypothetical protein